MATTVEDGRTGQWYKRRALCPLCDQIGDQAARNALDIDAWFIDEADDIRWVVAFETYCENCRGCFVALFDGFGADGLPEAFERASDAIWPKPEDLHARRTADAVLGLLVKEAQANDWRETLEDAIEDRAHPGLLGIRRAVHKTVDGMPFYSDAEVRVYQVLVAAIARGWALGIVPNSPVALLADGTMKTLYPDFQVVLGKKAGVIHVDGPHHRGRAAADHSQDRLLRRAGFAHIERIVVEDTSEEADLIRLVEEFLQFLRDA